jgi:hypothetical protein
MTNRKDQLQLPPDSGATEKLVDGEKKSRPKFEATGDEDVEQSLGSRVTFSAESIAIETESRIGRGSSREIAELTEETVKEDGKFLFFAV